jgi:5-methyltetrahydrofolate--homocysteine methyltransferase
MTFDTAGRTMMGVTSPELVDLVKNLDNPPVAFGANCGVGASDLLRTVLGFHQAYPEIPIVAKGNAGIPKYIDSEIHYDGTPELMAEYAVLARAAGAKVIGGCCGTTPAHLEKSLEAISTALGAFSSESDGTDVEAASPKRERRGRRKSATPTAA